MTAYLAFRAPKELLLWLSMLKDLHSTKLTDNARYKLHNSRSRPEVSDFSQPSQLKRQCAETMHEEGVDIPKWTGWRGFHL